MPLPAGTRIGPYEILGALGSGGMGDVYRARDTRLGRMVAVKTIRSPQGSVDFQRFELEARATSAITHPNIVAVYDVGVHDGTPFLVTELLEGETLRVVIGRGPLPPAKATEYARQIASGLAAAHERDVVHRDLKPENVFVSRDGHVKILDFGLAKVLAPDRPDEAATTEMPALLTSAGMILGTVSYMSPEQIRVQTVDHRTDMFAFGCVLFEMFTGRMAFRAATSIDTMHAILNREPDHFEAALSAMPPTISFVVRQCLEKNPGERLQSARDLALHLTALKTGTASGALRGVTPPPAARRRRLLGIAGAVGLVAAALAGGYALARRTLVFETPDFQQLTFRRGFVEAARFTSDGHTVIYSATWEGAPLEVFSTRVENAESRPLDLRPASVLAISPSGEIAAAINRRQLYGWVFLGTLARIPLVGGRPREVMTDVVHADWGPDGSALAAIKSENGKFRLEYPLGKVLYQSSGWMADVRVSRDGKWTAFVEHPVMGDDRGEICAIGPDGQRHVLSGGWASATGLAWSPNGDEVWFTASAVGPNASMWAVTTGGVQRRLLKSLGRMTLLDVSTEGKVLLTEGRIRLVMTHRPELQAPDRVLSWLDASQLSDISLDGTTLVFDEQGEGSRGGYAVYLRKTDGSPAVRLGDGYGGALSKDNQWVAALRVEPSPAVILLPTGAGEVRTLGGGAITAFSAVTWLPDTRSVLIAGQEPAKLPRLYVQSLDGGSPKPVSPEGLTFPIYSSPVSPDGRWVAAVDAQHQVVVVSLADGTARPLEGAQANDRPLRWAADSSSLFVGRTGELPASIWRVSLTGARRDRVTAVVPIDPAGFVGVSGVQITPDGRQVAYTMGQYLADLYLTEAPR